MHPRCFSAFFFMLGISNILDPVFVAHYYFLFSRYFPLTRAVSVGAVRSTRLWKSCCHCLCQLMTTTFQVHREFLYRISRTHVSGYSCHCRARCWISLHHFAVLGERNPFVDLVKILGRVFGKFRCLYKWPIRAQGAIIFCLKLRFFHDSSRQSSVAWQLEVFWAPHVHVENAAEGFPGSAAYWNGVLEALASLKRRPVAFIFDPRVERCIMLAHTVSLLLPWTNFA